MKPTYFKALILLFILIPSMSLAQNNQKQKGDSVLVLIKKYIAQKNTKLIYSLQSDAYKTSTSEKKLNEFFKQEIYSLGKIKESSFISLNDRKSKYKLAFESEKIELSFSLDTKNKITQLVFVPFKPVVTVKTTPVPTSNPMKSGLDKMVDSVARGYIQKSNTVGLSIGVLKDGQTYTYGYGTTQKENGKIPEANTIFEIASITKTFTAEILAYYVNQGKISLTDPITKYLPDSVAANPALKKITIVNLSNHTSGLSGLPDNFDHKSSDLTNPYKNYTKELFFASLKTVKLNSVPGEVNVYSNQAVGLLGIILERVSGKTYEELIKEVITGPLKMESTFQHLTPELAKRFVKVYDIEAELTNAWDFDALAAAGCLRSTTNDMLIYAKNNIESENPELSKSFALTHEITFSKGPVVGLGWHVLSLKGDNYYWHNGGTGGSRSFLIMSLDKKIAVVVLSNTAVDADNVGVKILRKLL